MRHAIDTSLLALFVAGLLLCGTPRPAHAQTPRPSSYAVLGLEDVTLRPGVHVEGGDVGANRGEVTLRPGVRVDGKVLADTIVARGRPRAGSLVCRLLVGTRRFDCEALATPVVDLRSLEIVQVVPGAAQVVVPANANAAPLAPGSYGDVRVGRRGRLLLAGGVYSVRSIRIGPRGRILCTAACRVSVQEHVRLRRRALLGAAAPLDAHAVRIDVEGSRRRPSFTSGARTEVDATIYAPDGAVILGPNGHYTGAFVGETVRVGSGSRVKAASTL
jgi:hypothetical protein